MNMSANVRIAIVMGLVVVLPVVVVSLMVQSLVAPQAALQHALEQRRRAQYEAARRRAEQERQLTMQRERERAQQAERERLEHEARESAPRTVWTLVAMGGFTKIEGLPKCNYRYEMIISGLALYMDIKYDNGTTRRFSKPGKHDFQSYTIGPFGPPYPVAVDSIPQELKIKVFDIERPCKERRKT